MTVSASYAPDVYTGNGLSSSFPFTFPILAAGHLVAVLTSNGTDRTLVSGTDYIATWAGPGAAGSIGLIAFNGPVQVDRPLEPGETLTLSRVVPLSQDVDLRRQGKIGAEVIERALDKGVMLSQQQQAEIDDHEDRVVFLENNIPAGAPVSAVMRPVVAATTLPLARTAMDVPSNDEAIAYAMIFG